MKGELKKGSVAFIVCVAIVLGIGFLRTNAQSINSIFNIQEEVDVYVSNLNPRVGEEVTISIQAPGTNLNRDQISWYVNGNLKASGVGVKSFKTTIDTIGKREIVEVRLTTDTGEVVQRSITLSAQDVDIIWEGLSYAPPFYQGKALYAPEGSVTLVAIPNIVNKSGVRVPISNLSYKWSVDGTILGDKSGYGKNSLFYSGSILAHETDFQVDVTAADGTTGQGYIALYPGSAKTVLYEDDPLYGVMFNNAITDGFKLKDKEIRVSAYPYFQSANSKLASNLSYAWALNNSPITVPLQKNSAVFRNSNDLSGTSLISVTTDNSTHILQHSETSANLNF